MTAESEVLKQLDDLGAVAMNAGELAERIESTLEREMAGALKFRKKKVEERRR